MFFSILIFSCVGICDLSLDTRERSKLNYTFKKIRLRSQKN